MSRYTGTAGVSNALSDLCILGGLVLGCLAITAYSPVRPGERFTPPVSCFVYPPRVKPTDQALEFCYKVASGGKNLFYIPLSAAIAATVGNLGCVYGRIRRKETSDAIFVAYLLYFAVLVFSFLLLLVPGSWTPAAEVDRQAISAILVLTVCGLHFLIGAITTINGAGWDRTVRLNANMDMSYFLLKGRGESSLCT